MLKPLRGYFMGEGVQVLCQVGRQSSAGIAVHLPNWGVRVQIDKIGLDLYLPAVNINSGWVK